VKDAIQQRVDAFVGEVKGLLQAAVEETRAAALTKVKTMLGADGSPPKKPRRAALRGAPVRRPTSGARPAAPAAAVRSAPRALAPRSRTPAAPPPSAALTASPPSTAPPADREATVLAAVRVLVRATASEVAAHTGMPNGSVWRALQALVSKRQAARSQTSRGAEYSLVSPGSVQRAGVAPPQ
jgi:hypothetical protein